MECILDKLMENIKFSISEFAAAMHGSSLDNGITVLKIDSSNNELLNTIIEEHLLMQVREYLACTLFVLTGEASASLDYRTYIARSNSILSVPPFKILTQLQTSSDFSGYIIIFSKNFIDETILNRRPPVSISQVLAADKSPHKQLTTTEMSIMTTCLDRVHYYLKNKGHRLRSELVLNTFYTFLLEIISIIFDNSAQPAPAEKSIKKIYIQKFIKLLVRHADKEHNPSFYADKLCISVQYLSVILKEVSGLTTNACISKYLVARAKTLLRNPDITILQITEMLNFSDQSSFGKFFKKNVGISPKKYRESHVVY